MAVRLRLSGEEMISKPIWCKCNKHSWTRRQLYFAWERDRDVRCPDPDCQRVIPVETVEKLLIQLGMVIPDDAPPGVIGHSEEPSDPVEPD